jgi:hypothetical protein
MLLWLLVLALMVGAVVDIVRREAAEVKFLPKAAWIAVVILLPLVGALLWFGLGRDFGDAGVAIPRLQRPPRRRPRPAPGPAPTAPPRDVRTTEQQIADLDREIEEWRLRQEVEKRRREQEQRDARGSEHPQESQDPHPPQGDQGQQGEQGERRG